MATSSQIDRAVAGGGKPVGVEYMTSDHLLAMPAAEREYAVAEITRAKRHAVHLTGSHEGQLVCVAPGHDDDHAGRCVLECAHPDHAKDELAAAEVLAMLGLVTP